MDNTIIQGSELGKRLNKIPKSETMYIKFQDQKIAVTGTITIGRRRENNICIDDNMASRDHAVIQKIKSVYFIKDLNSTNGTLVNDKPIPKDKYIKLYPGDVIKIGRTELTIRNFIE